MISFVETECGTLQVYVMEICIDKGQSWRIWKYFHILARLVLNSCPYIKQILKNHQELEQLLDFVSSGVWVELQFQNRSS